MNLGNIEQQTKSSFKRGSFYLPELKRCFVNYKDADEVYVSTGFGTCKDKYFEITTQIEHTMTSLASGYDWHYLYVDYSGSTWPTPTIIDSTTEPSWSETYQNYYNGDDLCLGSMVSPDASATLATGAGVGGGKMSVYIGHPVDDQNPDGTFIAVDCSTYIPVNASAVFVDTRGTDNGSIPDCWVASTAGPEFAVSVGGHAYQNIRACGWLSLPIGWDQNLYWYGQDNDDNYFDVYLSGFQNYRP